MRNLKNTWLVSSTEGKVIRSTSLLNTFDCFWIIDDDVLGNRQELLVIESSLTIDEYRFIRDKFAEIEKENR
jgi:hypothetical protein